MTANMDTHPIQKIVFFVAQDVDAFSREVVAKLIRDLSGSREWLLGPPKLVDVSEDIDSRNGDAAIQTLGGELEIYSALAPTALPGDIDATHFAEVSAVIEAVRRVSSDLGLAFEFELDGTFVGAIERGEIDQTMRRGLLDPWKEHLAI